MLILDDLLDISKIEAEWMDLENVDFSLRSALYLTLKTISVRAIEKRHIFDPHRGSRSSGPSHRRYIMIETSHE